MPNTPPPFKVRIACKSLNHSLSLLNDPNHVFNKSGKGSLAYHTRRVKICCKIKCLN